MVRGNVVATAGDEPQLAALVGQPFRERKDAETTHQDAPGNLPDRLVLLIG